MNPHSNTPVLEKLKENLDYIGQQLGIGTSFDVITREFKIGRKDGAFIFIDGFVDANILTLIMKTFSNITQKEIVPNTLDKIKLHFLPYGEISPVDNLEEAIKELLAGLLLFFIDGENNALLIDIRQYPSRSPEETDIEKVTRGSRDGFVETLLFNVTLIRRRIRDPKLRTEIFKIGTRSQTEVCLLYIEDIINPLILDRIRKGS